MSKGVSARFTGRGKVPPAETPLMRQYLEVKERYADAILMFRLGDFYEMFFEDAVVAARALDLTLTTRDKGRDDAVPMCGVPHHAVKGYVQKLLEAGHKVALCEQLEDPRQAKGIVRRDVTQVVTPGVVLDLDALDAKAPNFLCAVSPAGDGPRAGLAYVDLSTFEFRATEVEGHGALGDELARVAPREVICPEGTRGQIAPALPLGCVAREAPDALFADAGGLCRALGESAENAGLATLPLAARAAAAALGYAQAARPGAELPSCRLVVYRPADHLILDESTVRNLEICETLIGRRRQGSLLGVLDRTVTSMGGRCLRRWLLYPLTDVAKIRRRQDAVERLVEAASLRASLREELDGICDLERLAARAALALSAPRELDQIRRSLERLPRLRALLAADGRGLDELPDALRVGEDSLADVAADVATALREDPALSPKDGAVIRDGYDARLDELRSLSEGGRGEILSIERRERERLGIASLRVGYNRVFGYYLEVSRAKLGSAPLPPEYARKQTIAGAERFVTPELAEHEARVLGAEERRVALEQELFVALRARVAAHALRLRAAAAALASLDAVASLAQVAHGEGYARPIVDDGEATEIVDGRHPVVEQLAARGAFVPNDLRLDPAGEQILVITGPNMAGKSTVMRQAALITLMAQAGSFVPARAARLGLCDRIFTRVGASDDLARGESTFMLEMRETAHILRCATRKSLVVLDEIGRGTATYDGISIAWAVAEYLHDRVGARTLFATHYHELCALADAKPRVRNAHVTVREHKGEVVFLHRLAPGGASRSYGIQVARLAGLPPTVVARAMEILVAMDAGGCLTPSDGTCAGAPAAAGPPTHGAPARAPQLDLFGAQRPSPVEEALRAADPDRMTPFEALALVAELRGKLAPEA
ncbi:MAG: DNA mismatch repair protein MutS [Myxococcota bacterium]